MNRAIHINERFQGQLAVMCNASFTRSRPAFPVQISSREQLESERITCEIHDSHICKNCLRVFNARYA